jgi:diguanylate cyclase (GGDEF)-like protein
VLDTFTLRVAFGVVASCVLVLFYVATYRSTRSAYSGWWCVSLACFVGGALLYLLNDTPLQVVANPLGNAVGVTGAGGVWAAAASLRGRSIPGWRLGVAPVVVLGAALVDDPAHDVWSGGAPYLLAMAALIGLSSWELRRHLAELEPDPAQGPVVFSVRAMALISGLIGAFYLARAAVFLLAGPESAVFVRGFGPPPTTLLTLVLLVVVTFSMATLGHAQQTTELRVRATRDPLTGLLNRAEFGRAAQREIDRGRAGSQVAVLVADLDRFKDVNDSAGHAAGDRALSAFAEACESVVGARGLAGRLGGDEFVLLTPAEHAEEVASAIGREYAGHGGLPTVSFGIAVGDAPGQEVEDLIARADEALYRAKAGGRARIAR